MDQLTHVFVLLAALSSVGTAEDVYFTDGDDGTFEVRPPVTEKITSIIWKIDGDRVLDWSDTSPLEVYRTFKTRTNLNTTNGRLVIRNMTKDDMGGYTVEINNKVQSGIYDMRWMPRVYKPLVIITSCSPESVKCIVTCEGGTKETEPIEYGWNKCIRWKSRAKNFIITDEKHGGEKYITCRMRNRVSKEESEPVKNPLYKEKYSWVVIFGFITIIVTGVPLLCYLCFLCWLLGKRMVDFFKNCPKP